jgi:hypothetical protein
VEVRQHMLPLHTSWHHHISGCSCCGFLATAAAAHLKRLCCEVLCCADVLALTWPVCHLRCGLSTTWLWVVDNLPLLGASHEVHSRLR